MTPLQIPCGVSSGCPPALTSLTYSVPSPSLTPRQVPPRARPHCKIPTSGCFWGTSPGMGSTAQSAPHLTPSLLRGLGVWQGPRLPHPCLKLPSPRKHWLGSQGCSVTHSLTCTRAGGRGTVVKGPARHTARGWLSQDQKPEGRLGSFLGSFLPAQARPASGLLFLRPKSQEQERNSSLEPRPVGPTSLRTAPHLPSSSLLGQAPPTWETVSVWERTRPSPRGASSVRQLMVCKQTFQSPGSWKLLGSSFGEPTILLSHVNNHYPVYAVL